MAIPELIKAAKTSSIIANMEQSKMLLSMLHLILSCFRLPSSDKDSTNLSCFSTSTSIEIVNRSRGCAICPNGKMLLTDSNSKRLVILNNDGTLDKEITCSPYYPLDVTLIDDSTVANTSSTSI
jgi:hypothetical protein